MTMRAAEDYCHWCPFNPPDICASCPNRDGVMHGQMTIDEEET